MGEGKPISGEDAFRDTHVSDAAARDEADDPDLDSLRRTQAYAQLPSLIEPAQKASSLLKRLWDVTHPETGLSDMESERRWEQLQKVVEDAISDYELSAAEARSKPWAGRGAAVLAGSPETVDLMVRAAVDGITTDEQARQFLRGPVAQAIDRLEKEANATREACTDIALRVARLLTGTTVAAFARKAVGYLWSAPEEEQTVGYYMTLMTVAGLLQQSGNSATEAMLAYHLAVIGLTRTMQEESASADVSQSLTVAAGTMALAIAIHEQTQPDSVSAQRAEQVRDVQHRLKLITAVTVSSLDIPEGLAVAIFEMLGLRTDDVMLRGSILTDMGQIAVVFTRDNLEATAVEACGGAVLVGSTMTKMASPMLFNAAVALDRTSQSITSAVAQIFLNLLGMRWAFVAHSTLPAAMFSSGFDCAVNLLGSFVQWHREKGSLTAPMVRLAGLLGAVPGILGIPLWENEDVAKMAASLRALRVTPSEAADVDGLVDAVDAVIVELGAVELDILDLDIRPIPSTAVVVRAVLEMVNAPIGFVDRLLTELLNRRTEAVQTIIDSYAPFATGSPDGIGKGPLVEAGVITPATWAQTVEELLVPVASLAPVLHSM